MKQSSQRAKYLIKNIAIFTIGNLATKLLTFFLVPLYTNTLTTSEYGIVDLVGTICSVLAPILILNIGESVTRFSLDKDANYKKILSIGIIIYLVAIVIGLLIFPINNLFHSTANYSAYIYFETITAAGCQLFLCYLRGTERLGHYAFGGFLQTLLMGGFNIYFLVILKMGIDGYFLAIILAALITMIYAAVAGKIWQVFSDFEFSIELFLQMSRFSVVLIPNTFMWWIMNASDRIMVTAMVSVAANGIYAISYKLPTLVSTFTNIFNQAWSYSAIKEKGTDDEEAYNNRILRSLILVSMFIGITLLTFCKPFLKVYVSENYYAAWRYIPFLTIGCVYMAIGTFVATSYTVHKDSFGYLFSATFGAAINIVLNFLLIPKLEVYGAAIATCVSYIAVFAFRIVHTRKYIHYELRNLDFILGTILLIGTSISIYYETTTGLILQGVIAVIECLFFVSRLKKNIRKLIEKAKR